MTYFLPIQFSTEKRSILPAGDITQTVSDDKADIAVLEEPEHLTWYHHGRRWKNKFRKVIGVVHTNYLEYVKRERNGYIHAFLLKHINSWVTDIYCHKVSTFNFYYIFLGLHVFKVLFYSILLVCIFLKFFSSSTMNISICFI